MTKSIIYHLFGSRDKNNIKIYSWITDSMVIPKYEIEKRKQCRLSEFGDLKIDKWYNKGGIIKSRRKNYSEIIIKQ
ncbi:MAG: hypothetical protein Ta2E_10060 [Mycoplasmoidaceae bacterium]|nr:MAG: hypothetical protein Ta2E_10060 [Mycoplasmoidaceae bacterium]